MSNEVNEEFVYNLSKMLNVPVSEVVQKLGYVEMVGNPFWKSEEDRRSADPEPTAPAAPKGGDQRLSPEPKAAAAPAPTRMPSSTPNPMITEGDRELGGMGANAASGGVGAQGQRDGSWRGQTPEINLPGRVADNQFANQAGDGSFAGAARGVGGPTNVRNVDSDYDAGYGAQGVADFTQQIRDKAPRPQPQRPQPPVRGSVPEGLSPNPNDTRTDMGEVLPPNTLRDGFIKQEEERTGGVPPDTGPFNYPATQHEVMGPPGAPMGPPGAPSSALNQFASGAADIASGAVSRAANFGRGRLAANDLRVNQKSYSAIFNNNDPEAMLKKLAEITGVRQDEIVKKLGNANFSENPFFDKDPRY